MDEIAESISDDGFVTTSFLTFVPSVDDDGKYLSCSATNPQIPDFKLEDGWVMNVKCEAMFLTFFVCARRFSLNY